MNESKIVDFFTSPEIAANKEEFELFVKNNFIKNENQKFHILKKSIDARKTPIKINFRIEIYNLLNKIETFNFKFQEVKNKQAIHIVGAGPAGLFAALQCIELGYKPIIYERGKNVKDRRRDLAQLNKSGVLNTESNYCFGEGGAGTYSDGKLYTRSNKRGEIKKVLSLFCEFGAEQNIAFDAHPHIGTNKLPKIIESIRETILNCGGEIYFNSKLTNVFIDKDLITSIEINNNTLIGVSELILATGHSASDIYELLYKKNILIEAKPFALGVRVEHPQSLIDQIQYSCPSRGEYLPAASYSLVHQAYGRGVFSFCMCPGGIIAPASTHQNQLVVNGWSPSKRNNIYANSGMVVSVELNDLKSTNPLAALYFQSEVEKKSFDFGGGNFVAPAQRLEDFVNNKFSTTLPSNSYHPGVNSTKLSEVLPAFINDALVEGFKNFGKKLKTKTQSYLTNDAIVLATESRTSSPVRIPRHKEKFNHLEIKNLYPCAEGAGYAGGIMSAAMDGMNIVSIIAQKKV